MRIYAASIPSILAQGRIDSLSQGFSARSEDWLRGTLTIVAICLVSLLLAGIAFVVWKRRKNRRLNNPKLLFRELCKSNRLSWWNRRLLRIYAQQNEIKYPSMLFLNSSLWVDVTSDTDSPMDPKLKRKLAPIHRHLFKQR